MLQSIFTIFSSQMHWSQSVLGWKKIKHNKISETFALCRQMLLLSLEEMDILVYYQFLQSLQTIEFNDVMAEHGNDSIPIVFAKK